MSLLLSQFAAPSPSPAMSTSPFSTHLQSFSGNRFLSLCCVQLCLTLCNPVDCTPSCTSIHGTFQARILEQVAISYTRGSSWPRDQTYISYISLTGREILYHCATKQVHQCHFSRFHIYALTHNIWFSFWLTSLCIMVSRFIHLTTTDSNSYLFMAE